MKCLHKSNCISEDEVRRRKNDNLIKASVCVFKDHCQKQLHTLSVFSSLAVRKFGEFGKLPVIHQTKTIQSSSYN